MTVVELDLPLLVFAAKNECGSLPPTFTLLRLTTARASSEPGSKLVQNQGRPSCLVPRRSSYRRRLCSRSHGTLPSPPAMFAASVSSAVRRSAVHRSAAFLLPSASPSSAAGSSLRAQHLHSLFSSLSPSRSALAPSSRPIQQQRAFATTPTLATPRPGLLRRKHLGRIPHLAKASGPKTHSGAKKRFKSYKNGTVRRRR